MTNIVNSLHVYPEFDFIFFLIRKYEQNFSVIFLVATTWSISLFTTGSGVASWIINFFIPI